MDSNEEGSKQQVIWIWNCKFQSWTNFQQPTDLNLNVLLLLKINLKFNVATELKRTLSREGYPKVEHFSRKGQLVRWEVKQGSNPFYYSNSQCKLVVIKNLSKFTTCS